MKVPDLRNRRIKAGINRQSDLADALGWNRETLLDIERERIGIDEETLAEIEAAINRLAETCKEEKQAA